MTSGHLGWIPAGAALGFTASFVLSDLLQLPDALYHLMYVAAVCAFVTLYARMTGLSLRVMMRRRLARAVTLGALGGLVLMQRVFADLPSAGAAGLAFAGDLAWRGLVYGAVDGVLLSAFPWLVVWRASGVRRQREPVTRTSWHSRFWRRLW